MEATGWIAAGLTLLGGGLLYARTALALREARAEIARGKREESERERLFGTLVEAAPMAIVLLRGAGTIVFANPAARELLFEGSDAAGQNLLALLGSAPAPFRDALLGEDDALFTVGSPGEGGGGETYHLAKRSFESRGEPLTLVLVRHLTRELRRREVATWKRLLRVISHELNNSLAPISSMAHSARLIAKNPSKAHLLDGVFDTIQERTAHLKEFLEGYANLARLPDPRRAHVAWPALLARVREAWPSVEVAEAPPGTGWLDEAQIGQVIVNLVKNAAEAGEGSESKEPVTLDVSRVEAGFEIVVRDRGPGMSPEVLENALLPFYSTKERGTGLGLALCREIVEAHGGKIRLMNREGGGLEVGCFLPDEGAARTTQARLTVTRG